VNVLDATRIRDGSKVVLKCVPEGSTEHQIVLRLSSPTMSSDPRNRTVPIADIIELKENKVLLVMPYLRVFDTPWFHCRGEVINALRQFLQVRGLTHHNRY
jgi:hypothetical protein